jgi:hypothetical protein
VAEFFIIGERFVMITRGEILRPPDGR